MHTEQIPNLKPLERRTDFRDSNRKRPALLFTRNDITSFYVVSSGFPEVFSSRALCSAKNNVLRSSGTLKVSHRNFNQDVQNVKHTEHTKSLGFALCPPQPNC